MSQSPQSFQRTRARKEGSLVHAESIAFAFEHLRVAYMFAALKLEATGFTGPNGIVVFRSLCHGYFYAGQVDLAECDENERGNENGNENEKGKGRQITMRVIVSCALETSILVVHD